MKTNLRDTISKAAGSECFCPDNIFFFPDRAAISEMARPLRWCFHTNIEWKHHIQRHMETDDHKVSDDLAGPMFQVTEVIILYCARVK